MPWLRKYWDPDKGETGPPELKANKNLFEELKAEAPGVLAWMVQGCLEWQRIGLAPPKAVTEATEEYMEAEDTIATWIAALAAWRYGRIGERWAAGAQRGE